MSKLKTPLLSFGATGPLGDSVVFTRRRKVNILEKKPIPSYRQTLYQLYQRWLYQDYAYLWTKQDETTRRQYAASGSRIHLTGFQYWMKYHLTLLPDILAWWRFDGDSEPTTPDSSRNANTGTVFGASPTDGPIGPCFYFDGINDRIQAPVSSSLDLGTQNFSIDFLYNPSRVDPVELLVGSEGAGPVWAIRCQNLQIIAYINNIVDPGVNLLSTFNPSQDNWHHIAVTWNKDAFGILYIDGLFDIQADCSGVGSMTTNKPVTIGDFPAGPWPLKGYIDNVFIRNRVIDPTEVLRLSKRRSPP